MGHAGTMTPVVDRRTMLLAGSGVAVAAVAMGYVVSPGRVTVTPVHHMMMMVMTKPPRPLRLTDAQWRKRLTPEAYRVLREGQEDYPFTSVLNAEARAGIYACAGCELKLFVSDAKYDSGVGLPSFEDPLPFAVVTRPDLRDGLVRQAIYCAKCDGFLGHAFRDGPGRSEMRYSPSGAAMEFSAA